MTVRSPGCASSSSSGKVPGPYGAMLLADLGADVVAVVASVGGRRPTTVRPPTR